jgi:hypothetical protein
MVLVDFYSKELGRFFTKNGTDLLGITGAFFEKPFSYRYSQLNQN